MSLPTPDLLTLKEAGHYLRLAPGTLYVLRSRGTFRVPYIKRGRNILYRRSDLDAYLASCLKCPSS